ncbi:MAG: hypothetical protein K9L17_09995 [Clostridiales bacterium]|nr:hypothetical protein [Clostridiales bacterium]MCF8023011.1 hypothetical protein [Clostridiales bacterium]
MNNISSWTILIYANGNNELEPEMWKARLDAEKAGSNRDVNVLMQLGREDRQMVYILRPEDIIPAASKQWTGVRRYYIKKEKSILLDEMGNINMAHPKNLYYFLKWGIEHYPAHHYLVILGGHAFQEPSFKTYMPSFFFSSKTV